MRRLGVLVPVGTYLNLLTTWLALALRRAVLVWLPVSWERTWHGERWR